MHSNISRVVTLMYRVGVKSKKPEVFSLRVEISLRREKGWESLNGCGEGICEKMFHISFSKLNKFQRYTSNIVLSSSPSYSMCFCFVAGD